MKGLIGILLFVFAFGVIPADAASSKPETLRVQVNTEKRSPKSKLLVRFLELVEDSRCPVDVDCIWAGNATIKIRVKKNGRSHDLTLEINGPQHTAKVAGYSIKLVGLTPEPRSNIRIDRNGYVATFSITK